MLLEQVLLEQVFLEQVLAPARSLHAPPPGHGRKHLLQKPATPQITSLKARSFRPTNRVQGQG